MAILRFDLCCCAAHVEIDAISEKCGCAKEARSIDAAPRIVKRGNFEVLSIRGKVSAFFQNP